MKMKPELYSCLKALEALNKNLIRAYSAHNWNSVTALCKQYDSIRDILREHLDSEQFKFIQYVSRPQYDYMREPTLQELISASDIAISYLRSLEADLDKELREEKKKLRLKEDELARKEKEIESLGKIFKKSIEAVSQLPEVQRSKAVRDMKKAHREIEKYTKKKK